MPDTMKYMTKARIKYLEIFILRILQNSVYSIVQMWANIKKCQILNIELFMKIVESVIGNVFEL